VCGFTSLWTLILTLILLAGFAAVGIGCVINPVWGIRHFGQSLRKGGELLTEWNRLGILFVGLTFGGFAIYLIYIVLRGVLLKSCGFLLQNPDFTHRGVLSVNA